MAWSPHRENWAGFSRHSGSQARGRRVVVRRDGRDVQDDPKTGVSRPAAAMPAGGRRS